MRGETGGLCHYKGQGYVSGSWRALLHALPRVHCIINSQAPTLSLQGMNPNSDVHLRPLVTEVVREN